ncbi:MAG TPA: rod shape-determining protein MreD [Acidobacteriota bacterium]|nr:rod shape-determining protein MreD [Acidobacteriota bacterium]
MISLIEVLFSLYLPFLLYVDLFLLYSVYTGLTSSQLAAAYGGFAAGMIQDVINSFPVGINGFSKTVLGFVVATFSRYVVLDSNWLRLVVVVCASILNSAILGGLLYILDQAIPVHFFQTSLIQATCTSAAALVLFQLADRLRRGTAKQLARPYAD